MTCTRMDGLVYRNGARFDARRFWALLDAIRMARGLSCRDLATETGVSPSTLTRLARGIPPCADALASLAWWSRVSLDGCITPPPALDGTSQSAASSSQIRSNADDR